MSNPLAGMSNIQFNISNSDISSIFIEQLREKHARDIQDLHLKIEPLAAKTADLSKKAIEEINNLPEVVEYLKKARTLILAYQELVEYPELDIDWANAPLRLVSGFRPSTTQEDYTEDDLNYKFFNFGDLILEGMGKRQKTRLHVLVQDAVGRYCFVNTILYNLNQAMYQDLFVSTNASIAKIHKQIDKLRDAIAAIEDFDYEDAERKLISQMTRQVLTASPELMNQLNTIYNTSVLQLPSEE